MEGRKGHQRVQSMEKWLWLGECLGLSFLETDSGYSLEIHLWGTEEGRIRQDEKLTHDAVETETSASV